MDSDYIHPSDVLTPRNRNFGGIEVLCDTGAGGWSLVRLYWDDRKKIGLKSYGFRWNGNAESKGYPTAHGNPSWCILPRDIAEKMLREIDNDADKNLSGNVGGDNEIKC